MGWISSIFFGLGVACWVWMIQRAVERNNENIESARSWAETLVRQERDERHAAKKGRFMERHEATADAARELVEFVANNTSVDPVILPHDLWCQIRLGVRKAELAGLESACEHTSGRYAVPRAVLTEYLRKTSYSREVAFEEK